MGVVISKNSIVCSAFTVAALYFGLDPVKAFVVGNFLPIPLRMLFGTRIFSQTGSAASLGAIIGYHWLKYSILHSYLLGVISGYFYLYWWLFIYPRIFAIDRKSIEV